MDPSSSPEPQSQPGVDFNPSSSPEPQSQPGVDFNPSSSPEPQSQPGVDFNPSSSPEPQSQPGVDFLSTTQGFTGATESTSTLPKNDAYPVRLTVDFVDHQSRLMALFSIPFFFIRGLLLIPQAIAVYIITMLALVAAWINFFVVLFTGHGSKNLHNFLEGTIRWNARVSAFMYGLTDKYPPFRLRP